MNDTIKRVINEVLDVQEKTSERKNSGIILLEFALKTQKVLNML
jgi:hypothetical protein